LGNGSHEPEKTTMFAIKKRKADALIERGFIAWALVAACSGVGGNDSTREAAIAHAGAGSELFEKSEMLRQQGWTVPALESAEIERFEAPAGGEVTGTAEWTRVSVAVVNGRGSSAKLILAWRANGTDQFAIKPGTQDSVAELLEALAPAEEEASEDSSLADEDSEISVVEQAATCSREHATCASNHSACCHGLGCYGPDNHETCNCSHAWTSSYPYKATTSIACFELPDNPFGEAYYERHWSGCDYNGSYGLASGMCTTVVVPSYTRSITQSLICHTGSPC
jgi:hypothetical protein